MLYSCQHCGPVHEPPTKGYCPLPAVSAWRGTSAAPRGHCRRRRGESTQSDDGRPPRQSPDAFWRDGQGHTLVGIAPKNAAKQRPPEADAGRRPPHHPEVCRGGPERVFSTLDLQPRATRRASGGRTPGATTRHKVAMPEKQGRRVPRQSPAGPRYARRPQVARRAGQVRRNSLCEAPCRCRADGYRGLQ